MSRDPIGLAIPDLSTFVRNLRAELSDPPSHLEMLGLVARAAGFRNYQHLRVRHKDDPSPVVDHKAVARAARFFDAEGRFSSWPSRTTVQALCLWVLWARLPPRQDMTERQISSRIHALCTFRDAAQIRRSLVENGLATRTLDGAVYTRCERPPTAEARALIGQVLQG